MSQLYQDFGATVKHGERKVLLATTCYENPDASYTFAMQNSREALHEKGIQTAYFLLSGNCHVDDARNVMVQEFLLSDCTEMIFIDADVSWRPADLVKLCGYEDCDIVGGVYPFRRKSGDNSMPVRMVQGQHTPDENDLLEVEGLPTGFMLIKRHVLAKMAVGADSFWNKTDRRSKVPILFERTFKDGTRWGGDLNFCNKWKAMGGKVHAAYEMRLGHTGKTTFYESLGSALRKRTGETLRHLVIRIRDKKETFADYSEAISYMDNPFCPMEDTLALSVLMARKADGPIIEAGSGLTTLFMAAANPNQTVYCLENSKLYAEKLREMAYICGLTNIGLCLTPIKDGWYDLAEHDDLPKEFAMGLNDGPPRQFSDRMIFFEKFGNTKTIICDDANEPIYAGAVQRWTEGKGRQFTMIENSALIE